jgi:glycosyltransferase involved in cell wall biosynthesis
MKNEPILNPADLNNPFSIIHNFEVSIIIPFYKKLDEFERVLPQNAPFFQRNGIEVIISLDEDSQQDGLVDLLKQYPFINWCVIVNHQKHEWRNPVKAINVGIKHATKKYVMICSPESEFQTDAIYQLRNTLEHYDHHFVVGSVAFALYCDDKNFQYYNYIPYGSIMVRKDDLLTVGGYDETLYLWGGDDDNIRVRLEMFGIKKNFLPEVRLIHREKNTDGVEKRREKRLSMPIQDELEIYYPNCIKVNQSGWGQDFNDVIYNWQHNQYAKIMAEEYLNRFVTYKINNPKVFTQKYQKILLAQSYNEQDLIVEFLENMALYFDGIILLDDGSTDNTFELAINSKILLKVKKKRTGFVDIENRNLLLDLASFFSLEWLCFMDTDERFDNRFADFDKIVSNKNADVILFNYVNIWNDKNTYNADYPYSNDGIMEKLRMFRNIGHSQIHTSKVRVHFNIIPHKRNVSRSEIFFKHYGMASSSLRREKYNFYQKEDIANDQSSYEHMLNESPRLLNVHDIICQDGFFYNTQNIDL